MKGLYYGRNGQVSFDSIEEFYFTLGFLSDYRRASLYWEHNEDQGAWGSEGRIHCLIPETRFPQCFRFTAGRGSNIYARVNCNDYVGMLVMDHKFKTNGCVQKVEEIISTVPEQFHDIFMKGYGGKVDVNKIHRSNSNENISITKEPAVINCKARVGDTVKHKTFGIGKIKKISGSAMVVTFGREDKNFQYPTAFTKGFLSL